MKNSFGNICREWRKQKRYSQLQLAIEMGISSKHISFIETGRSNPSKEMILRIGTFLALPKREINRGLHSAGYSHTYTELPYEHENLKLVFSAIDQMLVNHMPYPAIVLNQNWDVVKTNDSAQDLLEIIGFSKYGNLIKAIIDDFTEAPKIINWQEASKVILIRLRHEISMLGGNERLEKLEKQLALSIGSDEDYILDGNESVLSVKLQASGNILSFFSIIAQLGSVQDVVVSEFKVELMFPADEKTVNYYLK